MKHILVAVDGSPGSRAAVAESVDLAHETGADLTFLGVRHRIALLGRPYYQRKLSAQLARLRPALEQAVAEAEARGVEADSDLLEGDVVEEILRAAIYREADLIVVGSRGLGPVAGAVLGSVSKALVELSPTPVLVAKERARRPVPAAG
jgi:nucleotide-binding universal stress UspA family protein